MTSIALGTEPDARQRFARFGTGAAYALLAILPVAMVVANRSAPAVVAIASLLALAGAVLDRRLGELGQTLKGILAGLTGQAILAFVVLAALSIAWSGHRGTSLFMLGEALVPLGATLILAMAMGRTAPLWAVNLLAVSFALAGLLMLVELWSGLGLRIALGRRAGEHIFNRPLIMLLLLYGPLLALLARVGRGFVASALGILLVVAMARAESGAAVLGLGVFVIVLALARLAPRATHGLVLAGLLIGIAIAPFQGDVASKTLSEPALDALQSAHARDRIAIWRSFGEVVKARPVLGTGFGTSARLAEDRVAAEVPPQRREMLGAGHPHNAFLQIWSELGLTGAGLAAAAVVGLMRALANVGNPRFAPSVALVAAIASIALVAHGAWQGWWIASIGATIVWFRFTSIATPERTATHHE